jgi:hypothetical protein
VVLSRPLFLGFLGACFSTGRINHLFYYYYLLTAIGLMPGGSVTKIGRTNKKWTYIARKQNIHLTKKQHVHLTKKTAYLTNTAYLTKN